MSALPLLGLLLATAGVIGAVVDTVIRLRRAESPAAPGPVAAGTSTPRAVYIERLRRSEGPLGEPLSPAQRGLHLDLAAALETLPAAEGETWLDLQALHVEFARNRSRTATGSDGTGQYVAPLEIPVNRR